MADGEKGEVAADGAEVADGELEFEDWTYRLLSLERVEADEIDDGGEDIFTAKFQVDGPNANAEIEITVSDHTDEAHLISIAQHTLHVARTMWGRVTSDRFIRARGRPAEARHVASALSGGGRHGGRRKGRRPGPGLDREAGEGAASRADGPGRG